MQTVQSSAANRSAVFSASNRSIRKVLSAAEAAPGKPLAASRSCYTTVKPRLTGRDFFKASNICLCDYIIMILHDIVK